MSMTLWINGQFLQSDYIFFPIYGILILLLAFLFQPKNPLKKKYFFRGLYLKIIGGVFFWLIYCSVYDGGDSWAYFVSSKAVGNLLMQNFEIGWQVLNGEISGLKAWSCFNGETGFPMGYMLRDDKTFSVARYTSILYLLSSRSFLVTTLLISSISFIGMWKFYSLVVMIYPRAHKISFYIILLTPSLIFWGGGIMKDTYVLSACCWFCYNFYMCFIKRKTILVNIFFLVINTVIIINIKSYIFLSLFPGTLLWLNNAYLKQIKNSLIRILVLPGLSIFLVFLGFLTFENVSSLMGDYGNVDSAIQQAQVIQADLLREEAYGTNSYNIGKIDGTLPNMISLAPFAIFTAIFRPLPWEIGSPIMIISALENSILIFFLIFIILKINPFNFFKAIFSEPFLLFCFTFTIIFGFGVGIASTNFGALARYKIPLLPYFLTLLYIIYSKKTKPTK